MFDEFQRSSRRQQHVTGEGLATMPTSIYYTTFLPAYSLIPGSVVYSPEMFEFLRGLWADVSPDLRAQYADAIRGGNLIALMAIPHLIVRGLTLIGIDPDALVVISFLDRWATVIVFASFLVGIVFRAVVGVLGSKKV